MPRFDARYRKFNYSSNPYKQRSAIASGLRARKRFAGRASRPRGALYSAARRSSFRSGFAINSSETKYFDVGINAIVTCAGTSWADSEVPCDNYVNSSGTAAAYTDSALIPTANGSGYGQVNGNRYRFKKLRVRGAVDIAPVSADTVTNESLTVRLVLVMDTQPNGAQAQGEDVFQDIGAAGENQFSFQRVSALSGRFQILKDKVLNIQRITAVNNAAATTVSSAFERKTFDMTYAPGDGFVVNVASGNATPTVAGLITCNIFMLAFAGSFAAVSSARIQAASRCYYYE